LTSPTHSDAHIAKIEHSQIRIGLHRVSKNRLTFGLL